VCAPRQRPFPENGPAWTQGESPDQAPANPEPVSGVKGSIVLPLPFVGADAR